MNKRFLLSAGLMATLSLAAQNNTATITVKVDEGKQIIPKEIYGQFAEHLGTCIYGGLWVGENSSIPNTNGYRTDVFNALKALKVPVLRWPGGCFADEYHWMDGIGPKAQRPKMVNTNWGGTVEDNSFGTHEFLNLCEMLGTEPYISGNVGSGSVEELAKWVEYMTADGESPMANLRRENGRDKPWKVKYLGVGNESWGCGGNMRPEYYADLYRRYSTYCRNFGNNRLFKVASGASDYDYNWTEVLMQQVGNRMNGLSLHFYSVINWNSKGSATEFSADDYYRALGKCRDIDELLKRHIAIMDRYDPRKRIALLLDEWGTWWDQEPGSTPGHLYQQNTMRDAFVASLSLDIFHKYTDRLKMANIAQIVNVLQSMILTNAQGGMVLTPTYHVFRMYNVHQDATYLPLDLTCMQTPVAASDWTVPMVSATASKDKAGKIHISLSNIDLDAAQEITIRLQGANVTKVSGEILTAGNIADHNTFEQPNAVAPKAFNGAKISKGTLTVTVPAKSIVALELN
ncbi:MAG: alpha-N-arabinofuranosidase [Prevotellaceae bacterium]|jgi:alpha-N-arabinofuranosidase|nr:alpha-N-arabinofuranosidase [Prevotellaceae bacterium]